MLHLKSARVRTERIRVPEFRQRKDLGDLTSLKASITSLGILNPIIVEEDRENEGYFKLIAGERRFRSAQELGLPDVPVRDVQSLLPDERIRIELEENIKRKELSWQEEAKAVALYAAIHPGTGQEQLASMLGVPQAYISRCLDFANGVEKAPEIAAATSLSAATNILKRKAARQLDNALDGMSIDDIAIGKKPEAPTADHQQPAASEPALPWQVHQADFLSWAPQYSGPRFNLIHCDFPYGLNMDTARLQSTGDSYRSDDYNDSPELYWSLVNGLLEHRERLIADSAHVIFWLSMKYFQDTFAAFSSAGFDVHPFPFIWGKSDGRSFLPDPTRWPRRTYEAALIMSLGDRKMVRAKHNIVWEPTTKSMHLSEKPLRVVSHLLSMYCDESSIMLDPTCGSGTALVAALEHKAKHIVGIELESQHHAAATTRLRNFKPLGDLIDV